MIKIFDARELELLVGGLSKIDIADWKKNTLYRDGYGPTSQVRGAGGTPLAILSD